MDEEYDCIVLGTGLKECVLSGLLSVHGKKVLHMDRNDYYGGESASLNISQLWKKYYPDQEPPTELGHNRYWNVDLIPKFLMAAGKLVKILVHTDVTRYLEFKSVDGSFVYIKGKVHKVPSNEKEIIRSSILGWFEKIRMRNFFLYLQEWEADNPATHQGMNSDRLRMLDVFKHYGLDDDTIDYIGHAMALHRDDKYLQAPARECLERTLLYCESMTRYGNSPYIYPLYGLGELPQAFARLSAIYGGTYMLDRKIDEIVYDDTGRACGVKSEGEVAKCKMVIGDPSYFSNKVKKIGQVVRCICILSHPIPNTNNAESCQIIIPQKQVNRGSDIYVSCQSSSHNICSRGKWVALISTTVETDNPELELQPGFALLGTIDYKFLSFSDLLVPTNDSQKDSCFISSSFDATTHFESTVADVMSLFEQIMGKPLDLSERVRKTMEEEQAEYIQEQTGGASGGV